MPCHTTALMALMAYRAAVHNGAAGLLLFIDAPGCSRQPEQTSVKKGWPWAARPGRSRKKKWICPSSLDPLCSNPF